MNSEDFATDISIAISDETFELVEKFISSTIFGSVQLIMQDGRLVQLERQDKIRVANIQKAMIATEQQPMNSLRSQVRDKILKSLQGISYGSVSLLIQQGKIIQIDRTQKQRVANLQGLDGDGI